jgi:hypothetical protein
LTINSPKSFGTVRALLGQAVKAEVADFLAKHAGLKFRPHIEPTPFHIEQEIAAWLLENCRRNLAGNARTALLATQDERARQAAEERAAENQVMRCRRFWKAETRAAALTPFIKKLPGSNTRRQPNVSTRIAMCC